MNTSFRSWVGAATLGMALLLGACATPAASTPAAAKQQLGQRVLSQYIQPRTRELAGSARLLQSSLRAYCERPADAARRTQMQTRLEALVTAWARVEFLRFGPLVENNRLEQFFFFPDPRGVVQRQLRTLLAATDPAALEETNLRQQSVAVQGVPALEYALYADDAVKLIAANERAGQYRCAYASAIAAHLARIADELAAAWQADAPLAKELARPAAGNRVYRSGDEVATEVLKALSTALHAARDQKLLPALGEDAASARATLLPLQRSGLTAVFLSAHLAGLRDFYVASGLGSGLPAAARWQDASLRDELQRAHADFTELTLPVSQALTDADQRDLLVHAGLVLGNARSVIDEYLALALGVNLGFNSLDGD